MDPKFKIFLPCRFINELCSSNLLNNANLLISIMQLFLTNIVHEFDTLICAFIETGRIDPFKVEAIDELITQITEYKKIAVKSTSERKDLIKIFSGINLIENFLKKSKVHLREGIAKKENPKSAKEIYQFQERIVFLANKIDQYTIKPTSDLPNGINFTSLQLRQRLRAEGLYPEVSQMVNLKDKRSKDIIQTLVNEIGL